MTTRAATRWPDAVSWLLTTMRAKDGYRAPNVPDQSTGAIVVFHGADYALTEDAGSSWATDSTTGESLQFDAWLAIAWPGDVEGPTPAGDGMQGVGPISPGRVMDESGTIHCRVEVSVGDADEMLAAQKKAFEIFGDIVNEVRGSSPPLGLQSVRCAWVSSFSPELLQVSRGALFTLGFVISYEARL